MADYPFFQDRPPHSKLDLDEDEACSPLWPAKYVTSALEVKPTLLSFALLSPAEDLNWRLVRSFLMEGMAFLNVKLPELPTADTGPRQLNFGHAPFAYPPTADYLRQKAPGLFSIFKLTSNPTPTHPSILRCVAALWTREPLSEQENIARLNGHLPNILQGQLYSIWQTYGFNGLPGLWLNVFELDVHIRMRWYLHSIFPQYSPSRESSFRLLYIPSSSEYVFGRSPEPDFLPIYPSEEYPAQNLHRLRAACKGFQRKEALTLSDVLVTLESGDEHFLFPTLDAPLPPTPSQCPESLPGKSGTGGTSARNVDHDPDTCSHLPSSVKQSLYALVCGQIALQEQDHPSPQVLKPVTTLPHKATMTAFSPAVSAQTLNAEIDSLTWPRRQQSSRMSPVERSRVYSESPEPQYPSLIAPESALHPVSAHAAGPNLSVTEDCLGVGSPKPALLSSDERVAVQPISELPVRCSCGLVRLPKNSKLALCTPEEFKRGDYDHLMDHPENAFPLITAAEMQHSPFVRLGWDPFHINKYGEILLIIEQDISAGARDQQTDFRGNFVRSLDAIGYPLPGRKVRLISVLDHNKHRGTDRVTARFQVVFSKTDLNEGSLSAAIKASSDLTEIPIL